MSTKISARTIRAFWEKFDKATFPENHILSTLQKYIKNESEAQAVSLLVSGWLKDYGDFREHGVK